MTNPLANDLPEPSDMLLTAPDNKIYQFLKIFVPKNIKNLENQKTLMTPGLILGVFDPLNTTKFVVAREEAQNRHAPEVPSAPTGVKGGWSEVDDAYQRY